MKPEWSKWAAVIVLAQVAGLVAYEFYALHRSGDAWPTITAMSVHIMRKFWWATGAILGVLAWLFIHLARRRFEHEDQS